MPGVTEQEIAQAKQMNLYQYMQLCEPDNFKPEGPGQFRHKGHSSLTFAEDGSWTYFKTKATGRTALNYLIAVEGVSFVEAVREINRIQGGVRPSFQPVKAPSPPAEKKPAKEFRLPKPDKNNYAATAYLRKRCIHPNVLTVCKQKRILYQTSFKDHPNCVFVGRDGNGEAKGGSLRGCSQIQFRRDIPGSKKIYPFYIEAAATADTVEVYEAPIDAMSGASLKIIQHTGNWRGVHYLALGGTDYAALDAFLTYYPNITHIVLCLDNDEAGRTRTQDIINDGRKLALDQRLMNPLLPDDPGSKANACVDKVYEIWEKTKEQHSTQMIFCDLSTPKEDGFDVYNDVRDKLVAKGIPKEEVQFIHDADTETKKAELFGKVRNGTVRVLMGSTQKMGAGTNVQTRLIALHHLDCPWRPADIAQRNGRMVRQGNLNKEVSIFIYVTESTFDSYSWQLVENP